MSSWFRSPSQGLSQPTWDATTVTMQQPQSPSAPTATANMVTRQPAPPESMRMNLRGGGAGDVCCGVCAGLLCFECCEDCC